MKIKYWLMVSYLIVMLLPIVAVYLLYISLSNYDESQDMKEYFHFQEVVADLEQELEAISLYKIQPPENYEHLQSLVGNHLKIDLYRPDGIHLYSSMAAPETASFHKVNQEILFQNINELQKNPQTYVAKRFVFDNEDTIVGLYEITLSRSEWVEASNTRTTLMIVLLSGFFLLLYSFVLVAINRKLNQPLTKLQNQMKAFADGKELDQPLTPSKDEIGVLLHHFEQMKTQIVETRENLAKEQREKEYMIASLSHDLKTPLTVIRTYTEALESHDLTEEERKDYSKILFEKLDHMKEMINDLAVFTALQSTENTLNKVRVNGEEFFEILFSGYEENSSRKDITLKTEIAVKNGYTLDAKQMMRLTDNLMDNAIRYTPPNHRIWLAGIASKKPLPEWIFPAFQEELENWRANGTVLLIQNEGQGIKESQFNKVFQPFYQQEASRGKGSTSGLGLSIVKMIIEKHDGKIKVWSTENEGTLIACWLKERNGL